MFGPLPLRCDHPSAFLLILLYPTLYISLPLFLFIFIFLSIALTRSIYYRPSGFLVPTPLRPWTVRVPEQEKTMNAHNPPVAAAVTLVDARSEVEPVDIVVLRRPDADRRVVYLDKRTRDWNWDNGTSSWIQCHCTGPTFPSSQAGASPTERSQQG